MMPSRAAVSASVSASSICGNRAQMNIPALGSPKISSPISSNARTTLTRAALSRSCSRARYLR
jgi:hypothetical protein